MNSMSPEVTSSSDNSTWGALRLFHHSERLLGLKSAIFEMGKAKNSLERHFPIDHEKQPRLSREPWFLGSTDKEVEIVCLILISPVVVLARETSTSSPRWSMCQELRRCAKGWDDVKSQKPPVPEHRDTSAGPELRPQARELLHIFYSDTWFICYRKIVNKREIVIRLSWTVVLKYQERREGQKAFQ